MKSKKAVTQSERPEREIRMEKLKELRATHVDPYPARVQRDIILAAFAKGFLDFAGKKFFVVGRVRSIRRHGKIIFVHIEDSTDRLQLVLQFDLLGKKAYSIIDHFLDLGDFVEVFGEPYVTKKGEHSLLAHSLRIIAKALRSLPDSWYGLKDEEERYRKRYLEMLVNPQVAQMVVQRSKFWKSMRDFMFAEGFIEVETPVLENTTGGADAVPFATHHNSLDIDVYLRISAGELWQKRLMVSGFEKTFEIGRIFRNEGMSAEHLQDYTQLEFYWAYADYQKGMDFVERLYRHVAQETFGTLQFHIRDFDIDLAKTWPRYDFREIVRAQTGVDILKTSLRTIVKQLQNKNIPIEPSLTLPRAIDQLWKYVRKGIAGPAFIIHHPVFLSPLAKRTEKHPELVERFQPLIAGTEIGNGYTELNDPMDQAERFRQQAALRAEGDLEAQMPDDDFVEALEYGMPPTCGFGVSERLFAFLSNRSVRECVLFPLLRPRSQKK